MYPSALYLAIATAFLLAGKISACSAAEVHKAPEVKQVVLSTQDATVRRRSRFVTCYYHVTVRGVWNVMQSN